MARWLLAGDGDREETDSESEQEVGEEVEMQAIHDAALNALVGDELGDGVPLFPSAPKKLTIKVTGKKGEAVCHVCGQPGHFAGFVGAKYLDCVNKPCYLCGGTGHSTQTCLHRIAPELSCTAAADAATDSVLLSLRQRESFGVQGGQQRAPPPRPGRWHVDAAVLKLHSRRTTCLEFHPTRDNIVLSGDKSGQIAVWDVDKVFERTVLPDINRYLTNGLRFMVGTNEATCATSSYDGTVKLFDAEIGVATRILVDANPRGWAAVQEEDKAGTWVTFLGLDVMQSAGVVVAGDNKGRVYFLDPRSDGPAAVVQAHKKNSKVQSVSVHPFDNHVVLSAGNDYQARLLDARCLGGIVDDPKGKGKAPAGSACAAEVGCFAHPRVINAAFFSPLTGRKIMTTAQDNRLRIWDYWPGSLAAGGAPDREIVHSHTFNRHLTPFKAEWTPSDPSERLAIIGRYISEDYGGVALHPVDLIDTATGATVGELFDPNLALICPVNKPHPRRELIVSGGSRSLYAWRPAADEGQHEGGERSAAGKRDAAGGARPDLGGSANFIFFDTDPGGSAKKRAKTTAGAKSKTQAKSGAGSSSKAPEQEEQSNADSDSE